MNKQEFSQLLNAPYKLSSSSIPLLEEVIKNFPYCQAAHIFLARATQQSGSMLTEQKVKKAAAYALDRQKLKLFIFDKGNEAPLQLPQLVVVETKQPEPEILAKTSEEKIKSEAHTKPEAEQKNDSLKNTNPSSKDEFYKELEENLKKLHQLKKDISKFKPTEIPKLAETPKAVTPETELPPLKIYKPPVLPPDTAKDEPEKIEFKYEKPEKNANETTTLTRHENEQVYEQNELITDSNLFLNYLSYLDAKRLKRDRKKEEEIIEKFIKEDPSIPYLTHEVPKEKPEDLSEKSTKIAKTPASENFAKILLLQGKRDKALEIYEELILKYPEKRAYFATKIEELKK